MLVGFSFRQTMSGSYWRLDAPMDERSIAFTVDAVARDVREFAREMTWQITGTIDAEQLAVREKLEGNLTFKLLDERRLPCRFAFRGIDGRRYELSGEGEWSSFAPLASLTVLPASLYDDRGEEIARATLRFDVRSDWARWVKSFRLSWKW